MSDGSADVSRRTFLRTAAGATAVSAASGSAVAQEDGGDGGDGGGGGGTPDFGGWFSDVSNFDSTVDETGSSDVTVTVGAEANGGNFGFGPAAVHVDAGTTVTWEWNGKGGGHNVVSDGDGPLNSGGPVSAAGTTYEYTFEEDGIYKYYCDPHLSLGMKGAIVVGSDYPTTGGGGGGATPLNPEHMGVPYQAHYVGIATIVMIVVSLMFTFFQLKYGESANTKGGNN